MKRKTLITLRGNTALRWLQNSLDSVRFDPPTLNSASPSRAHFSAMWSRQPPPRESHAAVGVGHKLYICGGVDDSSDEADTTIIESFDVPSVTWQQPEKLSHPLPTGLEGMAVTGDGVSAYCYGGRIGHETYSNTVYQINPLTRQCRELVPKDPSSAPKKSSGSCVVYFDEKLVVHGGFTGQEWTNQLRVFHLRSSEYIHYPMIQLVSGV